MNFLGTLQLVIRICTVHSFKSKSEKSSFKHHLLLFFIFWGKIPTVLCHILICISTTRMSGLHFLFTLTKLTVHSFDNSSFAQMWSELHWDFNLHFCDGKWLWEFINNGILLMPAWRFETWWLFLWNLLSNSQPVCNETWIQILY